MSKLISGGELAQSIPFRLESLEETGPSSNPYDFKQEKRKRQRPHPVAAFLTQPFTARRSKTFSLAHVACIVPLLARWSSRKGVAASLVRFTMPTTGHETVLLVEDDELVRDLARQILEDSGYEVVLATNGEEGLRLCKEFEGRIDLMITDVVMPEMNGRELAEHVAVLRPETKVLYMSGYTDDAIVRHGILDENMAFIQKPFLPDSLALKAREVLDRPLASD
jgi:CheY-like chemotaxis protein